MLIYFFILFIFLFYFISILFLFYFISFLFYFILFLFYFYFIFIFIFLFLFYFYFILFYFILFFFLFNFSATFNGFLPSATPAFEIFLQKFLTLLCSFHQFFIQFIRPSGKFLNFRNTFRGGFPSCVTGKNLYNYEDH